MEREDIQEMLEILRSIDESINESCSVYVPPIPLEVIRHTFGPKEQLNWTRFPVLSISYDQPLVLKCGLIEVIQCGRICDADEEDEPDALFTYYEVVRAGKDGFVDTTDLLRRMTEKHHRLQNNKAAQAIKATADAIRGPGGPFAVPTE